MNAMSIANNSDLTLHTLIGVVTAVLTFSTMHYNNLFEEVNRM